MLGVLSGSLCKWCYSDLNWFKSHSRFSDFLLWLIKAPQDVILQVICLLKKSLIWMKLDSLVFDSQVHLNRTATRIRPDSRIFTYLIPWATVHRPNVNLIWPDNQMSSSPFSGANLNWMNPDSRFPRLGGSLVHC